MEKHWIVYQAYSSRDNPLYRKKESISNFIFKSAKILAILGVFLIIYSFLPSIWFDLESGGKNLVSQALYQTAEVKAVSENEIIVSKNLDYQPSFDARLPQEPVIKIASIGLNGKINEATPDNYESALKRGVWRVSDFGTPSDRTKPTILAAHRFGYLVWTNLYRRENSFYNLPKLEIGSVVEIDWKQRKYLYEVYGEGKGDKIADYRADLILYTCEDLNSQVRIFKYAKLLEI